MNEQTTWSDGYQAGYEAGLKAAAKAITQNDKKGREWIMGSLWDTLARECSDRIQALSRSKS